MLNVFYDKTDDAPGKPWVLAEEEEGFFPDILDRFATEAEALGALAAQKAAGLSPTGSIRAGTFSQEA